MDSTTTFLLEEIAVVPGTKARRLKLFCKWALTTSAAADIGSAKTVYLVADSKLSGPAAYGVNRLDTAISTRGTSVRLVNSIEQADGVHMIADGLASDRAVAQLVKTSGQALPTQAESLTICRIQSDGQCTIVLCGGDAVGRMYAALDTAEQIGWATAEEDLFAHVRNTFESSCFA